MAYNSDGYIMLDFTEVDFRRTNQTIDGLFKRCVDVIGTNKFILVINANGRTPLPATCSFTNNQYVIDTVIYMFAVSSNDNLFIRRNDVPASDIIDDSSISVDKTWSSNKIDSELADYQPLLTAGTNITIDENNVISSTGGAVIDDSVIVNNKVWSSLNTVEQLAPIDTIVNNPAVFNTSLALPLVECSSSFTATQEGIGDPSPTNVRPIHGFSEVNVTANNVVTTIQLGQEVYGGTVDLVSGKLIITHAIIDMGSLSYNYQSQFQRFYSTSLSNVIKKEGSGWITPPLCEILKPSKDTTKNYIIGLYDNGFLYFTDWDYTTGAALKSAFTGYKMVYELATPFDIQLTPTQISTIIGANSIESDTGNIKVSYRHLPIDLI